MNKILKKIFLIILLNNVLYSYAQQNNINKDTIGVALPAVVSDNSIIKVLDSLNNVFDECVFYNLKFNYFFLCSFREDVLEVSGIPFDEQTSSFIAKLKAVNKVFFYYNEKLVIAIDKGCKYFNSTFSFLDSVQTISIDRIDYRNRPQAELGFDHCWAKCGYGTNGQIYIKNIYPCKYRFFHYLVNKDDTWETISLKIGTTKEHLLMLLGKNALIKPSEGDIIGITYDIDNGTLNIIGIKLQQKNLN